MAWAAITESDVLTVISAAELSKLRQASLEAGQADPLQPIIDDVTSLVRTYIARVATLGAANTIPGSLKIAAMDIVAVRLLMRLGLAVSEARQKAYDRALQFLQDVSESKLRLEETAGTSRISVLSASQGRVAGFGAGFGGDMGRSGRSRSTASPPESTSSSNEMPATVVDVSALSGVVPTTNKQIQWVTDASGDGLSGMLIYDASSTATVDNVDVFSVGPNGSMPGRWLRHTST